jgi:hypothetical protein
MTELQVSERQLCEVSGVARSAVRGFTRNTALSSVSDATLSNDIFQALIVIALRKKEQAILTWAACDILEELALGSAMAPSFSLTPERSSWRHKIAKEMNHGPKEVVH